MGDGSAQTVVDEKGEVLAGGAGAPVLLVRDLGVHFPVRAGVMRRQTGVARAVDGVSFSIGRGETLGLVGESGCGKTTAGRAILRLIEPTSGSVVVNGVDVATCSGSRLRRMRGEGGMQIVFQDPAGSLNPRMRIGEIVAEPLMVHGIVRGRRERRARAGELLAKCGLPDAAMMDRYPHEFSGGQKQRIAIARALATGPRLLVCDEPTSALDVSIQAQILNLLCDLRRELGLAMLFISHDMGVVAHMCDRIAVMRAGKIVEMGAAGDVIGSPREAYTRELLAAVPRR